MSINTVEDYLEYWSNKTPIEIKSQGVKTRLEAFSTSILDDKSFELGREHKSDWEYDRVKLPINLYDADNKTCSYLLGEFLGYNNIDFISSDEFNKLCDVMKSAFTNNFGILTKCVAYFGAINGKDPLWFADFCIKNQLQKRHNKRFYDLGYLTKPEDEFSVLDKELKYEYR